MDRIVVLRKTHEKCFSESEITIKELSLKIICIFVPYKRKLKRKDREKLINCISKYDGIFTNDTDLLEFETKCQTTNWISCFLSETINYLIRTKGIKKIAVESMEFSDVLKKTIFELGERYRVVELYTADVLKANDFAKNIYDTVGLPIKIKNNDEIENCIADCVIKIDNGITIYNTNSNITYTDVELELLYPLNKYSEIPIYKILKSGLNRGKYKDIIQKGMVKIIGEISK